MKSKFRILPKEYGTYKGTKTFEIEKICVETNDVFFSDRPPVDRFFVEDGLHLTSEAYDTLSTYARPLISDWMRASNTSS